MDQQSVIQKVFLLTLGLYLFASIIQIEHTHAGMPNVLQRALQALTHVDMEDPPYRDADLHQEFDYLQAFEP